jgi:hypothetical protein
MSDRRNWIFRGAALVTVGVLLGLSVGTAQAATGLSFLKIGAGARAVAIGDAVVSHVNDASATYWNPGAIPLMAGSRAEVMHNESFQGIRYEFASLTHSAGSHGAGLSFNGIWTDNLRAYNDQAEFEGHFGYYGVAVGASYGYAIRENLGLGAGVEYLREAMDIYSTSGLAVNLGMQMREILPNTSAGLAVLHMGSSMKYESASFDLPRTIQGGVTHVIPLSALAGRLLLAAEVRATRDEDTQVLLGTEYNYQDMAQLQFGYRTGLDTQDISLGVGFGRRNLRGEYAFVPFKENLGDQHRLALLLRW